MLKGFTVKSFLKKVIDCFLCLYAASIQAHAGRYRGIRWLLYTPIIIYIRRQVWRVKAAVCPSAREVIAFSYLLM